MTLVLATAFLAFPLMAQGAWQDYTGYIPSYGYGTGYGSNYGSSYWGNSSYDPTDNEHTGDIEMSKRARRIGQDDKYHETISVQPGALVEIWIELKNTSSGSTTANVTDELPGSVVYKQNTINLNGRTIQPGLTSGGVNVNLPAKSTSILTYQIYVCSPSDYPARAFATSNIGTATDAVIIRGEYYNYYSYGNQNCQSQNAPGYSGGTNYQSNPFGDWKGVNNSAGGFTQRDPFGEWTGVNNMSGISSSNPFAGWTGVNNSNAIGTDPNIFGNWYGVNNSDTAANPFGDWYGTRSNLNYDSRGYQTNYSNTSIQSESGQTYASSGYDRAVTPAYNRPAVQDNYVGTNFVAPRTGVSKTAPFIFAGLLTLAVLAVRNRRLLFN